MKSTILVCTILISTIGLIRNGYGQERVITMDEAIEMALSNNQGIEAAAQKVERDRQLVGTSLNISKPEIYYSYDENNIAPNFQPLHVWGVSQSIQFPTVYSARKKVLKGTSMVSQSRLRIDQQQIKKEVAKSYSEIVYWQQLLINIEYLDSLARHFATAAEIKFREGESNYLEKLTSEAKQKEVSIQLKQVQESIHKSYIRLYKWMQSDTVFLVNVNEYEKLQVSALDSAMHPGINYYADAIQLSKQSSSLARQEMYPDLQFSIFNGTNGSDSPNYLGVQAGVAIPLWYGNYKSRIKASKTETLMMEAEARNYLIQIQSRYKELETDLRKYNEGITYYETSGKELSRQLLLHAGAAFHEGEIDFLQYIQLLENAKTIENNYLMSMYQYNMTVLEINYLVNE